MNAEASRRLRTVSAAGIQRPADHRFLEACERRDGDAAEGVIHESMRATMDDLAPSLPSEAELVEE